MPLDLNNARKRLNNFEFSKLFIEDLGWSRPPIQQAVPLTVKDQSFTRRPLAQLEGVVAFEIEAAGGAIPDAKARAAVHGSACPGCVRVPGDSASDSPWSSPGPASAGSGG